MRGPCSLIGDPVHAHVELEAAEGGAGMILSGSRIHAVDQERPGPTLPVGTGKLICLVDALSQALPVSHNMNGHMWASTRRHTSNCMFPFLRCTHTFETHRCMILSAI